MPLDPYAARITDVILVLLLLVYLGEGLRNGLARSLSVIVGIAAGGAAAFLLGPIVSAALPGPGWRIPVLVLLSLALLVAGHLAGHGIGRWVSASLARRRGEDGVGPVSRIAAAVANVVAAALVLSLVAGGVAALGIPVLTGAANDSTVLRTIRALTPPPVAEGLARLRAGVLEPEAPELDSPVAEGELPGSASGSDPDDLLPSPEQPSAPAQPGTEPPAQTPPSTPAPPSSAPTKPAPTRPAPTTPAHPGGGTGGATDALRAATASVVRISGTAYACGQNQTGSGWVVAPGRVLTNAHVVAGVPSPVVEAPGGQTLDGRVVYFSAEDDLAVIAVDGLAAAALRIASPLSVGSDAIVAGYPYGGPFATATAEVTDVGTAPVRDIYHESVETRGIYTLAATVQPGDSGGPLLTTSGRVAGLVFAKAKQGGVGYAMTPDEFSGLASRAGSLSSPVTPGHCVAG